MTHQKQSSLWSDSSFEMKENKTALTGFWNILQKVNQKNEMLTLLTILVSKWNYEPQPLLIEIWIEMTCARNWCDRNWVNTNLWCGCVWHLNWIRTSVHIIYWFFFFSLLLWCSLKRTSCQQANKLYLWWEKKGNLFDKNSSHTQNPSQITEWIKCKWILDFSCWWFPEIAIHFKLKFMHCFCGIIHENWDICQSQISVEVIRRKRRKIMKAV